MAIHSAKQAATIDRLRIATPCPISWEQMTGDNRVRFCGHCQLNVYNVSELSRIEAEALMASAEGRICARLYRRADGTILTKDCPVGLRALRMQVSKRAAAVFAAIASISFAAFGQQSSAKDGKTACAPQTRITRNSAAMDHAATSISGAVLDVNGGVIPGAKVLITNGGTNETRETLTNGEGRFQFDSLAEGNYWLKIEAHAFKNHIATSIVLQRNQLINIDMILELAGESVTMGIIAESPLIDTSSSATTIIISGDIIRRLPIQ